MTIRARLEAQFPALPDELDGTLTAGSGDIIPAKDKVEYAVSMIMLYNIGGTTRSRFTIRPVTDGDILAQFQIPASANNTEIRVFDPPMVVRSLRLQRQDAGTDQVYCGALFKKIGTP